MTDLIAAESCSVFLAKYQCQVPTATASCSRPSTSETKDCVEVAAVFAETSRSRCVLQCSVQFHWNIVLTSYNACMVIHVGATKNVHCHHHHHHHHHHQSLYNEGRRGNTDDFTTSFLHFSLFSPALWDLANSSSVHSLMLSSHLFFCLPCLLPPFTVPCNMVLAIPGQKMLVSLKPTKKGS